MREIKFRGKRKYGEGFVYGGISFEEEKVFITYPELNGEDKTGYYISTEVKPETVGQYIGTPDINGIEIYEGDNVSYLRKDGCDDKPYKMTSDVKRNEYGGWIPMCYNHDCEDDYYSTKIYDIEVTGNIHDTTPHTTHE